MLVKALIKLVQAAGLFLFLFGGCALDSADMRIPIICIVAGIIALALGLWTDENYVWH